MMSVTHLGSVCTSWIFGFDSDHLHVWRGLPTVYLLWLSSGTLCLVAWIRLFGARLPPFVEP